MRNRVLKNYVKSTFLGELIKIAKLNHFRRKWIIRNRHNDTFPMNIFDLNAVKIGNYSYGELNIISYGNCIKLEIGNFVSISQQVIFMLDVQHYMNHISTYPFKVKVLNSCSIEAYGKGDIIIDDDVWIGYGSIIMPGVHIGKGAVIASGSIVTKSVPPYTIVGGVPAAYIRNRFDKEIIQTLLKFDFQNLNKDSISKNIDALYTKVDNKNIQQLLKLFNQGRSII